jgi:hypothetical protein
MRAGILLGIAMLLLTLAGCQLEVHGSGGWQDTDRTSRDGVASLSFANRNETVAVRDAASGAPLSGVQLFGMADYSGSLYVAADPEGRYHPVVSSGEADSYRVDRSVYLPRVDTKSGVNATSQQRVNAGLLARCTSLYGWDAQTVTVRDLRTTLAALACGYHDALVVCAQEPLVAGTVRATEVAQCADDLPAALQAIGWSYIYTGLGYGTSQSLRVTEVRLAGAGVGSALSETLLVVVAPAGHASSAPPASAVTVTLQWDTAVDLDLHLLRNGAELYHPADDCFWKYPQQPWGDPREECDDPRLVADTTTGYGPETIVLPELDPRDTYTVAVDYWGDADEQPIDIPTRATVTVTTADGRARTYTATLTYGKPYEGQYRLMCDIDGATGSVTAANRSIGRNLTRGMATKKAR